jgi:hypothetical protein
MKEIAMKTTISALRVPSVFAGLPVSAGAMDAKDVYEQQERTAY